MHREPKLERFNENVLSKYQIYNSLFLTLPFNDIRKTGSLLPLFQEVWAVCVLTRCCRRSLQQFHDI